MVFLYGIDMLSESLQVASLEYLQGLRELIQLRGGAILKSRSLLLAALHQHMPQFNREHHWIVLALEAGTIRILRATPVDMADEIFVRLVYHLISERGFNYEGARFCVEVLTRLMGFSLNPEAEALKFLQRKFSPPRDPAGIDKYTQTAPASTYSLFVFSIPVLALFVAAGFSLLKERSIPILMQSNSGRISQVRDSIESALKNNDLVLMQTLLLADPTREQVERWLFRAIELDSRDAVRLFLSHLPDALIKDSNGTTPLMLAARLGRIDILRLCLGSLHDLHAKDRQGKTALMHAIIAQQDAAVQILSFALSQARPSAMP